MFQFIAPLFLVGLAAALIPLIVHLSRSRRTHKMRFSTTRFFTDQFLRSTRMSRLRELMLLLFRMALFAFVALALAQPIFLPRGHALISGKRCVVLIIDNSASMAYEERGVPLFARSIAAARELVDSLRSGDVVSIVLAARRSAGPEILFPEPTPDLNDVRRVLDGLQVAPLGTDLAEAVRRAEGIASSVPAPSREVYVLSDLQDSGWDIRDDILAARTGADVLFFFVPLRPARPDNVAITAIQYGNARPMAGIPFALRPHVHNQSDRQQNCEIAMLVDGQKSGERRLSQFKAGRWAVPLFHHTFTTGGWHSGSIQLSGDSFPSDNRRHFAFEVLDAIRILAVNGDPSQVAARDELFFLRTALTASPEGSSPIRLMVVAPDNLARQPMTNYPLVILANVATLTGEALEKLESFVDGGGSLFVFLGDKVTPAYYNQYLASPTRLHGGLLPARLTAPTNAPDEDESGLFIGNVDYDHEALAAFQDPGFANLSIVSFQSLYGLAPGAGTRELMRANNGTPLLCEKRFGKGRVLLFASSCDRDWTTFPVRPAFLPWIHRLVAYLAQQPQVDQRFYTTGEAVPIPVSAKDGLRPIAVKKPDGTVGYATTGDAGTAGLVFTDTVQPGVYSLYDPAKPDSVRMFAVNLDGYESDLRYLDDVLADRAAGKALSSRATRVEAGLRELLPGRPMVYFVEHPERVAEASGQARHGTKLWDLLLLAALAVALFEPWLANRISRQMMVRQNPVTPGKPAGVRR